MITCEDSVQPYRTNSSQFAYDSTCDFFDLTLHTYYQLCVGHAGNSFHFCLLSLRYVPLLLGEESVIKASVHIDVRNVLPSYCFLHSSLTYKYMHTADVRNLQPISLDSSATSFQLFWTLFYVV